MSEYPSVEDWARLKGQGKWVQGLVRGLHNEAAALRRRVAELEETLAGDGRGSFGIERPHMGSDDLWLAKSVKGVVYQGGGEDVNGLFEVRVSEEDGGGLTVMCTSWHGVSVYPQASNVVVIKPGRSK